ncbi:hypothetical protein DL98DRAFT_259347 [Cadophora sp. DSE1049]|nr:hypothetical protein DL98DRAFT_259347 [Cadophora sp. DSE1049]
MPQEELCLCAWQAVWEAFRCTRESEYVRLYDSGRYSSCCWFGRMSQVGVMSQRPRGVVVPAGRRYFGSPLEVFLYILTGQKHSAQRCPMESSSKIDRCAQAEEVRLFVACTTVFQMSEFGNTETQRCSWHRVPWESFLSFPHTKYCSSRRRSATKPLQST